MRKLVIVLGMMAISVLPSLAQEGLRSTQLNIFKNGTYFIVREGEIAVSDGIGKLQLPPAPLLGTFWLTTTREAGISKVTYMTDTIKTTRPATSIPDLLQSNKGKKVRISYRLDEKNYAELAGTLMDYFPASGLVKIRTSDGKYAYLHSSDIRQLYVEETPSEQVKKDSTAYLARIEFKGNPGSAKLKLVYMQAGIQWIPSYNIKIINEKELQLEMRALVENFAEVIKDAELTLTVGAPNYRYGRATEFFSSPFLSNLLGGAAAASNQYMFRNQLDNAMAPMMAAETMSKGAVYEDYQEFNTEGEKSSDLYLYKIGKVSIPKNSKATFQVFSQKIPYKDNYKVSVPDVVSYASNRGIGNDPEQKFDVYHTLKLTNSTKSPLTTAPVFVMDEELRPLAQDEIRYTPVESDVSVNLSKSPDIIVTNMEEETGREERARVIDKNTYNRITLKGKITLQNLLEEKITLNVAKSVTALITDASDKGNIRKPGRSGGLNPNSIVEWEISLNPGEKKVVEYTYEVYVNARY